MLARMIDQDASHQLRRDAVKLCPILPARVSLVDELQVGLVDQRGWLQSMVLPFATQIVSCQPPQFAIHERHQLLESCLVAGAPIDEQLGNAFGWLHSDLPF